MTNSLHDAADPGDLIADATCQRELDYISKVTLWKYSNDPKLNFPPVVKIWNRNYRSRKLFDEFKARLIAKANDARALAMARQLTASAREARGRKHEREVA